MTTIPAMPDSDPAGPESPGPTDLTSTDLTSTEVTTDAAASP